MENKENNQYTDYQFDIDCKKHIDIIETREGIKSISFVKKISLALTGTVGLIVVGLIVSAIFLGSALSKAQQNGLANFITYGLILLGIFGILNIDILKLKFDLSKWQHYLVGLAFGIAMVAIPIVYTTIVSQFYEFHINENESGLREIIALYPVLSVFIFGLVGPVCEEFTYRVGIFGAASKRKWLAYLLSILIFAFAHFSFASQAITDEFVNLPIYLMSGALLAVAYDRFGLAASITAHASNNLYAVIAAIILSYIS